MRCAALLALSLAVAPAARADDATARAKKAFEAATAAFERGRYDVALAGYTEAYGDKPLPAFLFNIGLCHRKLGHHDEAVDFFTRYLEAQPKAKNRADVAAMLAEEEKLLRAAPPHPPGVAPPGEAAHAPASPETTTAAPASPAPSEGQPARAGPASEDAAPSPDGDGGDNLMPWLVGGGVATALAVGAAVTVALVATAKPAPVATIDLRGATP